MPAKILNPIPPQTFELVRDAIFQILSNEIASQYVLNGNEEALNAKVVLEKTVGINHSQMPMIVVSAFNSDSDDTSDGGQSTIDDTPTWTYFIDVYHKAKSDLNNAGDTLARLNLQRLMGVCRAILSDAQYKFLNPNDVPPVPPLKGIVDRGRVISMQIAGSTETGKEDTTSTVQGRLTFEVRMTEIVKLLVPVPLDGMDTEVRFELTSQGYKWTEEP